MSPTSDFCFVRRIVNVDDAYECEISTSEIGAVLIGYRSNDAALAPGVVRGHHEKKFWPVALAEALGCLAGSGLHYVFPSESTITSASCSKQSAQLRLHPTSRLAGRLRSAFSE